MEIGATNSAAIAQLATEPRSSQTSQPERRETTSLETQTQEPASTQSSSSGNDRVGSRIDTFA